MATCEITLTGETIGTVAPTSQERRQGQPAGGHAARPTTEPTAPKLNRSQVGTGPGAFRTDLPPMQAARPKPPAESDQALTSALKARGRRRNL